MHDVSSAKVESLRINPFAPSKYTEFTSNRVRPAFKGRSTPPPTSKPSLEVDIAGIRNVHRVLLSVEFCFPLKTYLKG